MDGLYKMIADCGYGEVYGLFVANIDTMQYLITHDVGVYFGEVCGKHSEISGHLDTDDITLVTTDENVIKVIQDNDLEMGYNPLTQMLSTYETHDLPENFNDDCWDDCTVGDYIRFKITGKLPNEE